MSKNNDSIIMTILDDARWAPSVENLQFWRFKIVGNRTFEIHVDYDPLILSVGGEYGLLHSLGCLLETISIAAAEHQLSINWQYFKQATHQYKIIVELIKMDMKADNALYPYLKTRSVNRSHYDNKVISRDIQTILLQSLPNPYHVVIQDSLADKIQFTRLAMQAGMIRYESDEFIDHIGHSIDYDSLESIDKMPLSTLGLTAVENSFFKWGLSKPKMMRVINRYMGGSSYTTFRLDALPILRSSAIFYLYDNQRLGGDEALINQGRMLQRFWLTIEQSNLVLQPCYILPVMLHYANQLGKEKVANNINQWSDHKNIFFCGRLGYANDQAIKSRSLRLPLQSLLL